MLTVTENAAQHLKDLLDQNRTEKDQVIRMVQKEEGGWDLVLANVQPKDKTFDKDGEAVLAIDKEINDLLSEMVLDVMKSTKGNRLSLSPKKPS